MLGLTTTGRFARIRFWLGMAAVTLVVPAATVLVPGSPALASRVQPVITATTTTFTTPTGSNAQWQLTLRDTATHKMVGRTTLVGSGTLSLATPNVPVCSFQADVLRGPPGSAL